MPNWSLERRTAYSERRKNEVAAGINVPPKGNAGNTDFRHTEESKQLMKEKVAEARERIIQERGEYLTTEGKASKKAKMEEWLTPERRKEFAESTKEALVLAKKTQKNKADNFAKKHLPIIQKLKTQGLNLIEIANKLNEDGLTSRRGTSWTDQTVRQILKRLNKPSRETIHILPAEITRKKNADDFAKKYVSVIEDMQKRGMNLSEMADQLNAQGYISRRGAPWTYQNVGKVIKRLREMKSSSPKKRDLSSELFGTSQINQIPPKADTNKRIIGWNRKG